MSILRDKLAQHYTNIRFILDKFISFWFNMIEINSNYLCKIHQINSSWNNKSNLLKYVRKKAEYKMPIGFFILLLMIILLNTKVSISILQYFSFLTKYKLFIILSLQIFFINFTYNVITKQTKKSLQLSSIKKKYLE